MGRACRSGKRRLLTADKESCRSLPVIDARTPTAGFSIFDFDAYGSPDQLSQGAVKRGRGIMSLRINSEVPDFSAETTQGNVNFHDWIGDGWAILFSHPKDFTPVCTTELGYMAGLMPEFQRRNCKIIGLSVDPVDNHSRWAKDIEETQ